MIDLSPEERGLLLRIARAAITDAVLGGTSLDVMLERAALTPALEETRAAFVTLREKNRMDESGHPLLRGCIGSIEAHEPLHRSVARNARQAALEDPRFPPVAAEELPDLSLEVSALTPLSPVTQANAIVPGRDGVTFEKGTYRSVFLPQVAAEQGWGTLELLEHLSRKAGLSPEDWRGGKLHTFRAEVFEEA